MVPLEEQTTYSTPFLLPDGRYVRLFTDKAIGELNKETPFRLIDAKIYTREEFLKEE
jgi:hypothetical protein